MPDGSRCKAPVERFTEKSFDGIEYSYVKRCTVCSLAWHEHSALSWMDPSESASRALQEAIQRRLSVPVDKTEENSAARDVLRDVVRTGGTEMSAMLGGPTGTGKTFLALHALMTCIRKSNISGLYAPEHILVKAYKASHDFSNPSRSDWGQRFLAAAKTKKLLVLDDFGQNRNVSEGCLDAIEQIIMYRYDAGLQMICTTNRNVQGLVQERGQRVMSRLREMSRDKFVVMSGKDWRASNGEE